MKQILINPVCRVGSTCLKEIEFGKKVIKSIQTLPKLQSKNDVNILFENKGVIPDFDGVVIDFWSLPELSKVLFVGKGQRRLEDNRIAVTEAKMKMDEKVIIIDPNSEEYHYPFPRGKDKLSGRRISRRDAILSLKGFPRQARQVFEKHEKDTAWRTLYSEKLLLSFIDWYVQCCVRYGADLILPPSPIIDGRSPSMIEISRRINEATQRITRARTEAYPSLYVPIMSDAFSEEKPPQEILDMMCDIANPHTMVILKFFRSGKALDPSIARRRLRLFLMAIDALKKDNNDNLAIMVLDTKAEGVAYFGNGIDLTCDPLGGVKDTVRFGRRGKREDTGDEVDTQQEEFKHFGRYYHPELREFLTIPEMRSLMDPTGRLPHSCEFCDSLEGNLAKQRDELGFPGQDYWNSGRRIHNFMCRREEDEIIREKVLSGDARAVELFLKQEKRGNKNLIDLLP